MYNVYSPLLGGFIAMDFETREDAQEFINEFHCPREKKTLRISK